MGIKRTVLSGIVLSLVFLTPSITLAQHRHPAARTAPQERPQAAQPSAQRPWLGVSVQELTPEAASEKNVPVDKGLLVSSVMDAGPADRAGLMPGDVITKLNGANVSSTNDFISRVQSLKAGDTVTLEISRDQSPMEVGVTLGAMPRAGGMMGGGMMGGGMMGGMMDGMECPMCPQDGMMGQKGMMGGKMMGHMGRDGHMMTPGPHFDRMYTVAVKKLGLTADQKKKTDALKSDYQKKAIRSKAELQVAEVELKDLLSADPVSLEKVRQKLNDIAAKKTELRFLWIKTLEDFKKVLTPEQKEKLKDMTSGMGMMGKGAGMGMMGGMCGMTGASSGASDEDETGEEEAPR